MAAVALDHHRRPATRTLHLPRGGLRPPIESWSQSDECCRVCGADKDYWRDDRPLYKVASPRVAASRGARGWIALCTDHGADPRIHALVRTGRHLPASRTAAPTGSATTSRSASWASAPTTRTGTW